MHMADLEELSQQQQRSPFPVAHSRPHHQSCCSASRSKGRPAAQSIDSANLYKQMITFSRKLTSRWTEGCYSGKVINYLLPSSWVKMLLPTSTLASWRLDHQICPTGEVKSLVLQEGSVIPEDFCMSAWWWKRQHAGPGNAKDNGCPRDLIQEHKYRLRLGGQCPQFL